MQQAFAFPEGILVPGLKPAKTVRSRNTQPIEVDLPDLGLQELSILALKQRGQK
jgi:hypothetical protein